MPGGSRVSTSKRNQHVHHNVDSKRSKFLVNEGQTTWKD